MKSDIEISTLPTTKYKHHFVETALLHIHDHLFIAIGLTEIMTYRNQTANPIQFTIVLSYRNIVLYGTFYVGLSSSNYRWIPVF